ncbi:MAG TPA: hypothetical protein VEW03_06225 [Longimicrobiaceae bacterium]|nr:hypothetical protein [Longimicrobiaceae bacterium]
MYCSTCGARVADGRANCQSCGAVVARMHQPPAYPPPSPAMAVPARFMEPMGICPRCGFQGQSTGYFARGSHVAGLVLLTVMTGPAMGAGGILYYLMRHEHRCCPRCGMGWGKNGAYGLSLAGNQTGMRGPVQPDVPVGGGGAKRGLAVAMFLFAAFMTMIGMVELEFAPLVFAAFAGGGGWLLHRSAGLERERRREALIQSLQLPVIQLAARKGGRLTVTDVATEMGWPLPRAEKVLNSLEDGLRVMSDITDDGVIVYDFLELRAGHLPLPAPSPSPTRSALTA